MRVLGWLPFALVATAGFAPLAEMRPASGTMPGNTYEVGAGAVSLGKRPYVEETATTSGLLWFSGDVSKLVTLSGVGAFDTSAVGVGGAARLNAIRGDRAAAGIEGQVGYAWGAFLVPVALRVVDETWLYASPRLGTMSREPSFGIPAGISVRIVDGFMLRGEAQVSWQDFKYYNRRVHLALGAAYQW